MTDDIWDGFTNAVVTIDLPSGRHRIEPRPDGATGDFPFDAAVHIVTPYNPDGVETTAEANQRSLDRFLAIVDQLTAHPTVGSAPDGSMAEPGRAIEGLALPDAIELGRRFGQRAIYRWSADALSVIGVDEDTRHDAGWRLVPLD